MLTDFLKGNHLLKSMATMPWLCQTKGLVGLGPESWVPGGCLRYVAGTNTYCEGKCLWVPVFGQIGKVAEPFPKRQ
jgi:hypothetical protein